MKQKLNKFIKSVVKLPGVLGKNLVFILILYIYVSRGFLKWLSKRNLLKWIPLFGLGVKFLNWLLTKIEGKNTGKVSKEYLIELAFRNMATKRNRTVVTIGGMALGVGAIVFLVSVGYGLERMVISKVTKLNELRMADITPGQVGSLEMNDEMREKILLIEGVEDVIPVISMVSKVKYNGSVLDVMAMGIEENYVKATVPKFLLGEGSFKDRDVDFGYTSEGQKVLGASSLGDLEANKIEEVVSFRPKEKMVPIWSSCETKSNKIGYIVDSGEEVSGERQWGERYYSAVDEDLEQNFNNENQQYSTWIMVIAPIWVEGVKGSMIPKLDAFGQQIHEKGCVMEKDILIIKKSEDEVGLVAGQVLGINSDEATTSAEEATLSAETVAAEVATTSANVRVVKDESGQEWVEYIQEGGDVEETKEITFEGVPAAEAYISSGILKLLGMSKAEEAVGKILSVSYIITDGTVAGVSGRVQSVESDFTIKGVVDDPNSNYYFFHLADAKRLGIRNYSQMMVVSKDKESLAEIRKTIESMGFKTGSAADTVAQIESIFGNLRLLLGLLGTIALAVASLGMFNTMTVSLLERTREVGVMKSIGMLSDEVKELFLAESLIMGIGGGTFGVLMGFLTGKILSLVLTSISVFKGQGAMDVSYIPWFFVAFIIGVSFVVGILTGWYPSKRARQISALNALRYE